MKFNTLFVAAICSTTLLNSCVFETAQERQLQITHTSLVDGDAFVVIQNVNNTAQEGVKYAEYAETIAESKDMAVQVKAFYTQFLPQLDSISNQFDVTLNPVPVYPAHEASTDSTVSNVAHAQFDYAQHAQHEIAFVKEQLKRLTVNTNQHLQDFGHAQLTKATELYKQIGGKEEAHAHH